MRGNMRWTKRRKRKVIIRGGMKSWRKNMVEVREEKQGQEEEE